MTLTPPIAAVDYTATLPAKRMAAGVLFVNAVGEVLIVNPTYKDYWEIPGGAVEADESPYTACCREVREELGLDRRPTTRILAVDWVPPRQNRTEGLMTIFDGGQLTDHDIARISIPADELHGYAFCTLDIASQRLSDRLARRLAESIRARKTGTSVYLEDGYPRL